MEDKKKKAADSEQVTKAKKTAKNPAKSTTKTEKIAKKENIEPLTTQTIVSSDKNNTGNLKKEPEVEIIEPDATTLRNTAISQDMFFQKHKVPKAYGVSFVAGFIFLMVYSVLAYFYISGIITVFNSTDTESAATVLALFLIIFPLVLSLLAPMVVLLIISLTCFARSCRSKILAIKIISWVAIALLILSFIAVVVITFALINANSNAA